MNDIADSSHIKGIKPFEFNLSPGLENAKLLPKYGENWPVVYIIYNTEDHENIDKPRLYVGETTSFANRFSEHLTNANKGGNKKGLDYISVICNDTYNKSSILDIEQTLIRLFQADNHYDVINANGGQSSSHGYYARAAYQSLIPVLWDKIKRSKSNKIHIDRDYTELVNSDIYKYSPLISLTDEQRKVSYEVLNETLDGLLNSTNHTSIVNGGAGTGKTILAVNMIYTLIKAQTINADETDETNIDIINAYNGIVNKIREYKEKKNIEINERLKIGFAVPMEPLRNTLTRVFESIGMPGIITSPNDIAKHSGNYDILFVDESHRLWSRNSITAYGEFDNACRILGITDPTTANQLDWIVKQSKTRILFYDIDQKVRRCDVLPEEFSHSISGTEIHNHNITRQMRCGGGTVFIDHIDNMFKSEKPIKFNSNDNEYDFKLFDNFATMRNRILDLNTDEKIGLCRVVSGISWSNWKRKGRTSFYDFIKKKTGKSSAKKYLASLDCKTIKSLNDLYVAAGNYDMEIDGEKVAWNSTIDGWVISPNAVNEMGCIHTIQGYDVNYIGVVIGNELDYDFENKCFIVNKKPWANGDGKTIQTLNDDELVNLAINTYKVMLKRGVKGCYVYACNDNMRRYLSQYIESYVTSAKHAESTGLD